MRKLTIIFVLAALASFSFDAAAQHRNHGRSRHYSYQRNYPRNYSYRFRPSSLFWGYGPRVIITTPPIILGRSRSYRRDYERGYEQGRREYELDRERRNNERYDRNRAPQDRQEAPAQQEEQYDRKPNRKYDDAQESQNIENDN